MMGNYTDWGKITQMMGNEDLGVLICVIVFNLCNRI